MNPDERIGQLEKEIREIAAAHAASQQRLQQIYDEVGTLRDGVQRSSRQGQVSMDPGMPANETSRGGQSPLEHFIGLKLIHLAGIIVLLTGISIGIKYAIDKDLISPLARIILAYCAGLVLLLLSVRLRARYNFFSAILFSGSMACWYFTTYGALAYYGFISAGLAFAIMIALTVFTIYQSIRYNRVEIALIGLVGAYGIPFLVSRSSGRIDLFFSYIFLINAAVVFLAFRKEWRIVSRLALLITWALMFGWLVVKYKSFQQTLALSFILGFYGLFVADVLLVRIKTFSRRVAGNLQAGGVLQVGLLNALLYVALLLVFGHWADYAEIVTGLMFLYVVIFALIAWRLMSGADSLRKTLAMQAVILLGLFFLFRLSGIQVTLSWIGLSVVLFIWGVYAGVSWPRVASVILVAVTLLKLITLDTLESSTGQRIICFIIIGVLLLAGSFYYQRFNLRRRELNESGK